VLSAFGHPALRVLLGLVILGLLVASGRLDLRTFAGLRPGPHLAALVGVTLIALCSTSFRWVALVRATGGDLRVPQLLTVALGSNALTYVSPGGAGTDVARAVHLAMTRGVSRAEAAGIAVADRLLGLQCLLLLAAGMGCWTALNGKNYSLSLILGAVAISGAAAAYALFRFADRLPKGGLPGRWRRYVEGLRGRARPGWLAAAWLASMTAAVANAFLPWLAVGVFQPLPLTPAVLVSSLLVVFANSFAPTPGGIGAGEAAASALFHAAGPGAPGMLLARSVGVVVSLVLGVPLLAGRGGSRALAGEDPAR
jgi:uncharacterized membrane protein YbhN (UPF0104 family)